MICCVLNLVSAGSFHVKSTQKNNRPPPILMKVVVDVGSIEI